MRTLYVLVRAAYSALDKRKAMAIAGETPLGEALFACTGSRKVYLQPAWSAAVIV